MATMLTINQVCEKYSLSSVYVRRMIQKGKLPTTKVKFNKNQFKHMISEEAAEKWRNTSSSRTQREDGRRKFIHYATENEAQELAKILKERKLGIIVKLANPPKSS